LVAAASSLRLEALGISDHDTFVGYDEAVPLARTAGLDLVCSVELSTKLAQPKPKRRKTVHILGYFLWSPPTIEFRQWLKMILASRRDRNARIAARLQELGVDVRLEEAEGLGRVVTGRPHFARLLVDKGYVSTIQEAFDVYLDESAKAYVERVEPSVAEGIERIAAAGGVPSLAHPIRLRKRDRVEEDHMIRGMCDSGLRAIEVYHSDHEPQDVTRYLGLAQRYGLAVTGGSDFHGDVKPDVQLGTGYGNLAIPRGILDHLRNSNGGRR
jgi:predicted metal-dependent phosphoesterase TrpH